MSTVGLRAVVANDAEWIHRACQDPEIQRWTKVPRPYTIDHARFFVGDPNLEYRRWVITDIATQDPVGLVSIHGVQGSEADIGYWVAPWGRGRGAGSAAVRAMTEIARTDADISRLVAYVAEENLASQEVVRRAGFADVARQQGPARRDLEPVPTVVFRLQLRP